MENFIAYKQKTKKELKEEAIEFLKNNIKIITDIRTTGSLKMFRLHLTKKYHVCFMKNTSLFNGKKGITVTLMKTIFEKGRYTPVFNRKYN